MAEEGATTITPPKEDRPGDTPPKSEPPRDTAARAPRATRSARSRSRAPARPKVPSLEERLADFFGKIEATEGGIPYATGIAGMAWIFDQNDGFIIATHSANMAKAWANLASQNERVRRYLEFMLSGSAWGEVFFATSPVILGILANHGVTLASLGIGGPGDESAVPGTDDNGAGGDGSVADVPGSVS